MLIQLTEIPRSGAVFDGPVRTIGLNPELIHNAVADQVPGYDGPATRLIVDDQVLFVTESVTEVIEASQEATQQILLVPADGLDTA